MNVSVLQCFLRIIRRCLSKHKFLIKLQVIYIQQNQQTRYPKVSRKHPKCLSKLFGRMRNPELDQSDLGCSKTLSWKDFKLQTGQNSPNLNKGNTGERRIQSNAHRQDNSPSGKCLLSLPGSPQSPSLHPPSCFLLLSFSLPSPFPPSPCRWLRRERVLLQ